MESRTLKHFQQRLCNLPNQGPWGTFIADTDLNRLYEEFTVNQLLSHIPTVLEQSGRNDEAQAFRLFFAIEEKREAVDRKYRKVLALLTELHHEELVQRFVQCQCCDDDLPHITDENSVFSNAKPGFVQAFITRRFCYLAPILNKSMQGKRYGAQIVMPFKHESLIASAGYSDVYKTTIHEAYDDLGYFGENPEYARKQLRPAHCANEAQEQEEAFNAEVLALDLLAKKGNKHVLPLLSAYKHGDHFNLLFPLADCNLKEYFETYEPPSTPVQRFEFLQEMLGLCSAVEAIHNINVGHETLKGLHCDLKPQNILRKGKRFTLADFGLTQFISVGRDPGLSRFNPPIIISTYRAPECEHERPVNRKSDIWPLGCIYGEALVYIVWGKKGWERFEKCRRDDANRDCFHDRRQLKAGVVSFLDQVAHSVPNEELIQDFLDLVLSMLSFNHETRPRIEEVRKKLQEMLDKASKLYSTDAVPMIAGIENRLNATSPAIGGTFGLGVFGHRTSYSCDGQDMFKEQQQQQTPDTPPPPPRSGLTDKSRGIPTLQTPIQFTEHRAGQYGLTTGPPSFLPGSSTGLICETPSTAPGSVLTRRTLGRERSVSTSSNRDLLNHLRGWDTLFLLDNSQRMSETTWKKITSCIRIFSSPVLQKANHLTFAFMHPQNTEEHAACETPEDVEDVLGRIRLVPEEHESSLANSLDSIISEYVQKLDQVPRTRPLSIIVLSDGNFDDHDDFSPVVIGWAQALENMRARRNQLGIQFVLVDCATSDRDRFSDLDDQLKTRDIVDHIAFDPETDSENMAAIQKALLGAMNRELDGLESTPRPTPALSPRAFQIADAYPPASSLEVAHPAMGSDGAIRAPEHTDPEITSLGNGQPMDQFPYPCRSSQKKEEIKTEKPPARHMINAALLCGAMSTCTLVWLMLGTTVNATCLQAILLLVFAASAVRVSV